MDIDKLEGRELNAAVAERVMKDFVYEFPPGIMNGIRHYSTDIAAAWLVHFKMCEMDYQITAKYFHALKDLLMEHGPFSIWTAALEFVTPVLFCRAALKALDR